MVPRLLELSHRDFLGSFKILLRFLFVLFTKKRKINHMQIMFYLVPNILWNLHIMLILKSSSEKLHFFIEVDTQRSYVVFYSDIQPFCICKRRIFNYKTDMFYRTEWNSNISSTLIPYLQFLVMFTLNDIFHIRSRVKDVLCC